MRYWILLAVITLAGCGQKGALYLPKEKAPSAQSETTMSTDSGQTQG